MNTLVNLEIAKLLKEKGFDLPCNNYTSQRDGDYFSNEKQTISYKNYNEITSTYSRPTIAEVVMWLYEKHGIWIAVDLDDDKTFVCVVRSKAQVTVFDNYDSLTEAYSQAIIYTLRVDCFTQSLFVEK